MAGIWGPPQKKQDKYKDKALRLMGVKPVNVLQSFLNSNGSINSHEYSVYWSQMRKQAHNYLRVLVENLMSLLEANKSPEFPIESFCNTIAFITLTYPITSDITLKNTLKKWEITSGAKNFGNATKDDNFQKMVDVVRLLKRRLAELEAGKPAGGSQSLINSLVVQASTMLSAEELKMVKDPVRYATVHGFKPSTYGGHCFAYNYLRTYSNESYEKRKEVLGISLEQLLTLRQQRQINYQLCQANLLALLHMVKQFVSMYRVEADFIERAQQVIKQFYLWPLPYGELALMSLIVLKKELKAPGSELLRRFAQESTVPEVQGYKTSSAAHELRDALYKRARPVYYFIHAMNPHAAELSSVMQLDFYEEKNQTAAMPSAEQVTAGLPVEVTCLLLLNAINYDVGVEENDFTNVRWLAEEDVYAFFDETVVILQKALENGATPEAAREVRIHEFRALKQKIHEKAVANSGNPPPDYSPVDLSSLSNRTPSDYMPPLPPVAHVVMPTRLYYHKSQFRPAGGSELVPVPRTHAFECIEKLVSEFKYLADAESAVRIRVVIGGGDQNLHTAVCAWTSFKKEYTDYLNGIEIQFFLVPFEENHLASFIARHDCWYKRHIYTPFRAHQFLLPSCEDGRRYFENPTMKRDEETELLPHGVFLREAVEDYIREASQTVEVNLFKVDVWRHPGDKAGGPRTRGSKSARLLGQQSHLPDKCIPFCQRVDIGYFAEVRKYKEKQQQDAGLSKKKFDYQPIDVNVQVYPVDATGVETANFQDINCAYQQISLSNVPFDKDLCFPANPLNDYLEMFADVSDVRRPAKTNKLVREHVQHVKKVSIRASSRDQQFSVLIDGSMFGPYYRIDVSPLMLNDSSKQLTLPIRTFFPIATQ